MPKPEKSEFVKIDRVGYFVPNCLRLSYYYHFKMIRPLKNANFRFSELGSSRSTDFRSLPEVKNSTIRKPLKSYTNPPKIIRLLPILHEQFKFYVSQHRRALVPCGLVWGQIPLQNRIPRTQISLSPNFQVNLTSNFWEIATFPLKLHFHIKNHIFASQTRPKITQYINSHVNLVSTG